MSNPSAFTTDVDKTFQKVENSSLFQTYQQAFLDATGLNLFLTSGSDQAITKPVDKVSANEFCAGCTGFGQCLPHPPAETVQAVTCYANLKVTALPVKSGNDVVAYLSTGRIFTEEPEEKGFDEVAEKLRESGLPEDQISSLNDSWMNTRVMPESQYLGITTMLAAFAVQLSDLSNRLMIENENAEPEIVTRAKQYICANLEEKIILEEVARRVGVSSFYFCKVFKSATTMTLTEYVNRRRVERAKQKLHNPRARVTEVAFDVGYQSLSQFNRSFLKYVGMSPTKFRETSLQEKPTDPNAIAA